MCHKGFEDSLPQKRAGREAGQPEKRVFWWGRYADARQPPTKGGPTKKRAIQAAKRNKARQRQTTANDRGGAEENDPGQQRKAAFLKRQQAGGKRDDGRPQRNCRRRRVPAALEPRPRATMEGGPSDDGAAARFPPREPLGAGTATDRRRGVRREGRQAA